MSIYIISDIFWGIAEWIGDLLHWLVVHSCNSCAHCRANYCSKLSMKLNHHTPCMNYKKRNKDFIVTLSDKDRL